MTVVTSENRYETAQLIVAPTLTQGANYTTIESALTDAVSGQTIFIRPGTYIEDLTLKAGVNLSSYDCDELTQNVTIVGKLTAIFEGKVSINGIRIQTNYDNHSAILGNSNSVITITVRYSIINL